MAYGQINYQKAKPCQQNKRKRIVATMDALSSQSLWVVSINMQQGCQAVQVRLVIPIGLQLLVSLTQIEKR